MRAIHFRSVLPIAFAVAFAACSGRDDTAAMDSAAAADSARDLARAGVDSATQPQLKDVPVNPPPAPAPSRPKSTTTQPKASQPKASAPPPAAAPAPTPAPAPKVGTIATGATLSLTSNEKVCTNTHKVGDRFNATLSSDVNGTNGAVIPVGSTVTIEATELKRSEDSKGNIVMGFRVVSVTINGRTYNADAEVVTASIDRVRSQKGGDDAKKVAGGAAAGAIVGQILGRNTKGTLIGAAVGAAAGAAAASATSDYEGCVNAGAPITVRLTGPLTIQVAH
jgi:hypothetical protein